MYVILITPLVCENVLSLNIGSANSINHTIPFTYNIKHNGFSHFSSSFMILPVPALGSVSKPIFFVFTVEHEIKRNHFACHNNTDIT